MRSMVEEAGATPKSDPPERDDNSMKLAVLADIHGNLPALQAVLADIAKEPVDRIVNLGDCASGPLWPAETVALLRTLDWPTVRGNHDRLVGCSADGDLGESDSFTWRALDDGARGWLAHLPKTLEVEGTLCMHGLLEDDEAYLIDAVADGRVTAASAETIAGRIGGGDAKVLLCGHSHAQRAVSLPHGVMAVNPGSVGWQAYRSPAHTHESGSPHARYAILDLSKSPPSVDLRTVAYDWKTAAMRAERNGRPDWAHALRTGLAL